MFKKNIFIFTKVVLIFFVFMIFITLIVYDCNASIKKVQKAEELMKAGSYYESFKMISKIKKSKKGYKEGQELLVKLKEKAFSYYEGEINNKVTEKEYIKGVKIAEEALLIMPENEQIQNMGNNAKNLLFKSRMSDADKLYKEKKYEDAMKKLKEIEDIFSDSEELEKKISDIQFRIDNKEMGTVVNTKKYELTVLSTKVRNKVGGVFFEETPGKGAIFVIVKYRYKNITDESIGIFSLPGLELKDLKGNTYDTDTNASIAYALEIDAEVADFDRLNPGITNEEYKVFKIPQERWKEKGWSAVVKADKYIGYILK